ncbi:MAG: SMP-30/gluconolactonase/LRE family protein [Acidimicrobiales bacterium]
MKEYTATVVREGLGFGEGPRWHEGRLWYSDFYRHAIFSMAEDGADEVLEHHVATQPSGLGWLPDGDLLCVSMTDQKVLRFHAEEVSVFADISEYCEFWANDMVVSPAGYSYVGNFGFDLDARLKELGVERFIAEPPPSTNLIVLDPAGDIIQVIAGMDFPNGTVITPDGATLIVGETFGSKQTAFDVGADGTLSNRRTWAPLEMAATDGMCLDAEGQIWFANALTRQCVRVREGGEVTGTVTCSQHAYACMLGGTDGRTLFIMTCRSSDRFEIADTTDGRIETVRVDVAHAGTP